MMIHFTYTGSFNDEPVSGTAVLYIDSSSGDLQAFGRFEELTPDFNPVLIWLSKLSKCCINEGKPINTVSNIAGFTKGQYSSIRNVEIYDAEESMLGSVTLRGLFSPVGRSDFVGRVCMAGSYKGPTDLPIHHGYSLTLEPVGKTKLRGTFEAPIQTQSGVTLNTLNEQIYHFPDGTTRPLEPLGARVTFDTRQSYWDMERRILRVVGNSIVFPPHFAPSNG